MSVEVFGQRPDIAVACGCVLGEGALWDHRTGTLLWVDINGEEIWSWRPGAGRDAASRPVGERVGFVLLTDDPDTLVLGLKSGLARWSAGEAAPVVFARPEADLPGNRLNDGVAAPDGSIYFGSLNETDRQPSGGFYRWAPDGSFRFGVGTVTTNGPAIDAERKILYATDTSRGRVMRYDLRADGTLGAPEDFVGFASGEGRPDGMAVDAESHVWICHFGGGRITRFDPEGEPVLIVPIPTPQPTKLAFGGPALDTVYVTTAARDLDRAKDPFAGHVLSFRPGIAGRAAAICRPPSAVDGSGE